ncbi:mRNA-decapping enzyme-like protein, partial [Linum grandiflorum]
FRLVSKVSSDLLTCSSPSPARNSTPLRLSSVYLSLSVQPTLGFWVQQVKFKPRSIITMSQNGKLMPNLDQQSTKLLNLTVLQRIDPFVEEILITAAHVTFYEFNVDLSQWSRKDVEGSLFVVKRNAQPRFQFIVMNRRNTVNGIWFYNPRECEDVANLFTRILNAYAKVPPKSKVSSSTKSEFEELEAVPTMAVMDGPLEPSSVAVSSVTDVPDDHAFINFFSVRFS